MRNDPVSQFGLWYDQRRKYGLLEPDACTLSTSKNDKPSARVVLLKWYNDSGFTFVTNYLSAKAKELDENSNACLLFYWDRCGRQIKITGKVHKISTVEADAYFRTRPFLARLASWASIQSSPMKFRYQLILRMAGLLISKRNLRKCPPFWGGYTLVPERMEFFEHSKNRINHRVVYEMINGKLQKTYLYP